jgi:hypothetical protein
MVLIMDVARFKHPPHWVPLPLLWEGAKTAFLCANFILERTVVPRQAWDKHRKMLR